MGEWGMRGPGDGALRGRGATVTCQMVRCASPERDGQRLQLVQQMVESGRAVCDGGADGRRGAEHDGGPWAPGRGKEGVRRLGVQRRHGA